MRLAWRLSPAPGGGVGWALLNFGIIIFGVRAMHARLLRGELKRWYTRGILLPLLGATIPALVIRSLVPYREGTRFHELAIVAGVAVACTLGAGAFAETVRTRAVALLSRVARRASSRLRSRIG